MVDPAESLTTLSAEAAHATSQKILAHINAGQGSHYRVLTGDRTTGSLHIGHYFGSLRNRVMLQNCGVELFLILADYQALTDRDADQRIKTSVFDIILDYLAVGIDPEKSTVFTHSHIPELNELIIPFLGVTTLSELQRNPTIKDEIAALGTGAVSGLMLTYPVHQAADILFCHGNLVPAGKDQLPHIETTRVIARRMNQKYFGYDYFPEPNILLSTNPMIQGIDGRKMSKSFGNTVQIKHTAEETAAILKKAKTDSEKKITYEPIQRPEIANLLRILSACTDQTPQEWADEIGNRGSGTLKKNLIDAVNSYFAPFRERRKMLEADPAYIVGVLAKGNATAKETASKTLSDVHEAMGLVYY